MFLTCLIYCLYFHLLAVTNANTNRANTLILANIVKVISLVIHRPGSNGFIAHYPQGANIGIQQLLKSTGNKRWQRLQNVDR